MRPALLKILYCFDKCQKYYLKKKFFFKKIFRFYPAGIDLFKMNNRNTRVMYKICSELTKKIPEQCQWGRSRVFIVKFEQILQINLVFPLLILNK